MTVGFGPVDGGFLTGPKSKLETATNHETNHETNHVWNRMLFFFCGKMLGRSPVFLTGLCIFFVSMMVMVGFGPVDGRFLTGPNSKMERVAAGNKSCVEQNVFFSWQDVGKESSFFDWAMHFF